MMSNPSIRHGIYFGNREQKFKEFITGLLNLGPVKQNYIDILTSDENMKLYSAAFTSDLVDDINNYQVFEQLGDKTVNKFIVWYIYRRFPQLKCPEGVKVAARVQINYCSKTSFAQIAEKYGFWNYITATNELRERNKIDLLEDVFEAFIGVTEWIIDNNIKFQNKDIFGVGYASVYRILEHMFNKIDISLKHEDLYDAKTRLKEVFDLHGEKLGVIQYENTENPISETMTEKKCRIYRLNGAKYEQRPDGSINTNKFIGRYTKILIGEATAQFKAQAEQQAASLAIKNLEQIGFIKYAPAIYAQLSGEKKIVKETLLTLTKSKTIEEAKTKVNVPIPQKGKNKYQSKYMCTPIFYFAKKRDHEGIIECLRADADVTLSDSDGLTLVDRLLVGNIDVDIIQGCLDVLYSTNLILKTTQNIYDQYKQTYKIDTKKVMIIN